MDRQVHFAKVFGIVWAVITGLWAIVFFHGADFSVGFFGHSRPPMWVLWVLLWAWPVVPAIAVAALWELTRLAMLRKH
jgi:hypothetical protein